MARSQQTFGKREKEKKRLKKREEKQKKKEARKAEKESGAGIPFAYVDKFGNLTDTPPEPMDEEEEIDASEIVLGIPQKVEEEYDPIRKGKVSFFDHSKGFGFIIDTETQEKHFVHVSGLIDEINENDKVTFELEKGQKGMNAVRVSLQG
jgi:cold shock CspA family protein